MSAPMVRALLDGSKTQTRRILKPGRGQKWLTEETLDEVLRMERGEDGWWRMAVGPESRIARSGVEFDGGHIGSVLCPYGQPRDGLWVREAWGLVRGGRRLHGCDDYDDVEFWSGKGIPKSEKEARGYSPTYRADWADLEDTHFKPSIHMPRWVSRITLEVTDVRVERLQSISEADAVAEGVKARVFESWSAWDPKTEGYPEFGREPTAEQIASHGYENVRHHGPKVITTAVEAYRRLWGEINGYTSWDANPWAWVLSFRRIP